MLCWLVSRFFIYIVLLLLREWWWWIISIIRSTILETASSEAVSIEVSLETFTAVISFTATFIYIIYLVLVILV